MKLLFMGTPDLSVYVLEALLSGGYEIAGVVTQPDKPKGRGKSMQPTPVKEKAQEYHIPVYQPKKVRDPAFIEVLREINPDMIVVAAFGQIIPKAVLDLPAYGCINVHTSLLPAYRGAAPIQWAVINGEKESGVSVMQMDEGLDTGDVLSTVTVPIEANETGGSLFDKLAVAGAALLLDTIPKIIDGSVKRTPQPKESTTAYARMIKKSDGLIDWTLPAVAIERLIRGLNPWPSAYTYVEGRTLKIWRAKVSAESADAAKPGTVVREDKRTIYVQTGDGLLELREVQIEGKRSMNCGAFMCGFDLPIGTVLGESGAE